MGPKATPAEWAEMFLREVEAMPTTTVESQTTEESKCDFSRNLIRLMLEKGISSTALAEKTGLREQRIRHLRSIGLATPESSRVPGELKSIAQVLGCTVSDLFAGESKPTPATSDPLDEPDEAECVRMLRKALSGPKRQFVIEAVEMGYTVAVASRTRT